MTAKPAYPFFYLIFIGFALATALLFAPPYPESVASTEHALERKLEKLPAETAAPKAKEESDAKDRLRALEDRERQTYALVLEGQRKTMDWWLSFLAIFTAVLALGGAFIPFLLARKDKEQLTELLRQAQETARKLEDHHSRAMTSADSAAAAEQRSAGLRPAH